MTLEAAWYESRSPAPLVQSNSWVMGRACERSWPTAALVRVMSRNADLLSRVSCGACDSRDSCGVLAGRGLNHRDTENTEIRTGLVVPAALSVLSVSLWFNPSLLRVSTVSAGEAVAFVACRLNHDGPRSRKRRITERLPRAPWSRRAGPREVQRHFMGREPSDRDRDRDRDVRARPNRAMCNDLRSS
jgi:hypothetical protein